MANINKIKLSGTSYDIQDSNAARSVTLTQAEYDALQTKDPNVFYIISDSSISYMTSGDTESAITQAVSGKADTSAVTSVSDSLTAHTANTTVHVTVQDKTNWNNKSDFSGDYNDLSNKPTIPTVPTNVSDFTNDAGYITSDDISGKTNQSDFTAHTANTTVHVTSAEKSTWNAKSDFSGNYNDLSNKPTIPSKTSDLTNDSNFATTGDVQTATNDMATKTWVGQQGYLTQHQDISGKQDVSGMTAYTTTATTSALNNVVTAHTANTSIHVSAEQIAAWNAKSDFSGSYNDLTNKLSAGTNITIVDNVISATGGGKAVAAGRGISVTTGETADTVSFNLPISAGTGTNSIKCGETDNASGTNSFAIGANGVKANGIASFAGGSYSEAKGIFSMAFGRYNTTNNYGEAALGFFNKSNGSSSAAGNSSNNTLFSVGNGTNSTSTTRHNAFEIRQNGDIYCSDGTNDVKLQDTITATAANTTALGGLSLVKLTQAQYDALATKDSNTLYVING